MHGVYMCECAHDAIFNVKIKWHTIRLLCFLHRVSCSSQMANGRKIEWRAPLDTMETTENVFLFVDKNKEMNIFSASIRFEVPFTKFITPQANEICSYCVDNERQYIISILFHLFVNVANFRVIFQTTNEKKTSHFGSSFSPADKL